MSTPIVPEVRFGVVTAARNCARWIRRCLRSIQQQTQNNFECVFIDDVSTDDTYEIARRTVAGDARFRVLRNDTRLYPLGNVRRATELVSQSPGDVIVIVDGDDWLKHPGALERAAAEYRDPEVWLTYGSNELYRRPLKERLLGRSVRGIASEYPEAIRQSNAYRKHWFLSSHLRTYKKFLWDGIRDEDLRDTDGEYFKLAGDAACMLPMLEMATARHIRFIEDILYVYNNDHSGSENRPEVVAKVLEITARLQKMARYAPLSSEPTREQ